VSERKLAAGSFWHPVDMLGRIGEMLCENSREDILLEKGFSKSKKICLLKKEQHITNDNVHAHVKLAI